MARRSALEAAKNRAEIEQYRLDADLAREKRKQLKRLYEGAQSNQYYPKRGDRYSADAVVGAATHKIRAYARYLDENHDLAIGVLDELQRRIVGCGITVEPMVKRPDGKLHEQINKRIRRLWIEWTDGFPEASRTIPWPTTEALVCRSWLRDGEILIHHIEGAGAPIKHGSRIPYSLEIVEPDYLPFDLLRQKGEGNNRIVHGVELNDWKQPIAYHLYKEHPGDTGIGLASLQNFKDETKRVSAQEITHLKFARRFGQTRGVSLLHGVLRRLEDIKEYEESERIAARVAAAFTAVIKKSADFQGAVNLDATTGRRSFEMAPGMIFDQLLPGEDVSTISSDRPNSALVGYRDAMLRAVASGTGTSHSSISRNYDGTYSSQRQELVEAEAGYEAFREHFVAMFRKPVYRRFIDMAVMAGLLPMSGADRESIYDADYIGMPIPWIDPLKEINADALAVQSGFKSRHMVIRERGYDPSTVDEQLAVDDFDVRPTEAKGEPSNGKSGNTDGNDSQGKDQEDAAGTNSGRAKGRRRDAA